MTDPRRLPDAWVVRRPGTTPALFLDLGRALAYAARVNGTLGALYEGPPPADTPTTPPAAAGRNPEGGNL